MTIEQYKARVASAKRIVFFGGAGVSTESGIPDFRSVDGLYNQKYDVPPEVILSYDYFCAYPDLFYKFYFDKMIFRSAQPNAAKTLQIRVLYGCNHCVRCGKKYSLDEICAQAPGIPKCSCGGIIKPDVVLYGEALPEQAVLGAVDAISKADMLIVGGTSLSVYPAASFINYYRGNKDNLIVINKTHIEGFPNQLNGKLGELL